MKIISIQPYYFRAFGSNQPILLSKELNVFYGNNGTGKSSLAEAVEWLFFGYTRRRIKGDQYSKREYKGSYINKHCPLDINPFVEVVMENEEGQQHILRRTIIVNNPNDPTDDEYLLEFDNREIDYLEHAGLVFTEAHCPVVVQHGIQDFIHTRPIDRYRIISEALGLSQLVKFKDALESARKQLQSNPPDSVLNARRTLKKLSLDLGVIGLTDLQHRWQNGSVDLDGDYSTIIKTAQNLIGGTTSDIPQIIKELEIKQELEMKRVFDISPFRPPSTLETNTEKLIATVQHVKSSYEELKKTTKQLLDVHFNEQLKELVEFQTRGYELLEKHDTNEPWLCPFCKEKTITNELLTQIKDNLQKHEGNHNTQSAYDKQLGKTQQDLTHLRQQFEALQIPHLKRENQATLTSVFDKEKGKLEEFLKGNQEIQALTLTANSSVKRTEDSIKLLKNSDALEKILTSVDVLEKTLGKTFTALSNFSSGIKKYRTFFLNFEPVLIKELSDEESVARYTALLNLFRERPNANLVVRYQEFENQVLEARRKTDEHVLEKQTEVLSTQEQKILKWYETLSPNKNVRFSGIEPGKNLINLKATAFGEELNAAASMSQSQLNCLGLSIYIPSVLNEISPFNFIIFDDPVQAMDDDHHEAFKNNVVKKLLEDFNYQVMILTHIRGTANSIKSLYQSSHSYYYYEYSEIKSTGPVLKLKIFGKDDIEIIKRLAQGSETEREIAVDRIRVICEEIIRESYLQEKHETLPSNINTAKPMLVEYRKLSSTHQKEADGLAETINWSNPAHHSDPAWAVPKYSNIEPHINRVETFIKNLSLANT